MKFVAVLPLLMLVCGCGSEENVPDDRTSVPIVGSSAAYLYSEPDYKEFPFIAKPRRVTELSFRVSGELSDFDALPGTRYKKGDVIAKIDQRDYVIRRDEAESFFREAEAEYLRMKRLYDKNNVSASAFEKSRADYISAKSEMERAVNALEDSYLTAPFDGYVSEVFVENYQDVRATEPIVSFVDVSQLKIELFVTEDVVMRRDGLENISLSLNAFPGKRFDVDVEECSRTTTSNNLSYKMTLLLDNPGEKLPAGISGKVSFNMEDEKGDSVVVPHKAVCHRPSVGDYLWIVGPDAGRVSLRRVKLGGLLPGGGCIITEGVKAGERVATGNLRFLSDGAEVIIKEGE